MPARCQPTSHHRRMDCVSAHFPVPRQLPTVPCPLKWTVFTLYPSLHPPAQQTHTHKHKYTDVLTDTHTHTHAHARTLKPFGVAANEDGCTHAITISSERMRERAQTDTIVLLRPTYFNGAKQLLLSVSAINKSHQKYLNPIEARHTVECTLHGEGSINLNQLQLLTETGRVGFGWGWGLLGDHWVLLVSLNVTT